MRTAVVLCVLSAILAGGVPAAAEAPGAGASAGIASAPPDTTAPPAAATTAPPALIEALAPFAFLLGDWEGAGSGTPYESAGRFSFQPVAEGHAILLTDRTEKEDGLHAHIMVIYPERGTGSSPGGCRALYVDNAGRTLHYAASASADTAIAYFKNDTPGQPEYQLCYKIRDDGTVMIVLVTPAAEGRPGYDARLLGLARRVVKR